MDDKNLDANPMNAADTAGESMASPLSRRKMLVLGAAGATAVATVRPAFAQTAVSVLNCEIPVPDAANAGKYIAGDGSLVPAGTAGSFPGVPRPFKGEEVKQALAGRTLPGTSSYEQNRAYMQYIKRLRSGQSGFTCYASILTPR